MSQLIVQRLQPLTLVSPPADETGRMVVSSDPVPFGQALLIDRANTYTDSVTRTYLDLYEDDPGQAVNRRSGSSSGNTDEADYPGGLLIGPTRRLYGVWTGASPGAVGVLTLQVREVHGDGRA